MNIDEAASAVQRELQRLRELASTLNAQVETYRISYEIVAQEAERLRVESERDHRLIDKAERERDLAEATLTAVGKHLVEYRRATRGEPNEVSTQPRPAAGSPYAPRPRVHAVAGPPVAIAKD
jgi:DNA repair exonuclease SbcCD ATPase subunit